MFYSNLSHNVYIYCVRVTYTLTAVSTSKNNLRPLLWTGPGYCWTGRTVDRLNDYDIYAGIFFEINHFPNLPVIYVFSFYRLQAFRSLTRLDVFVWFRELAATA